tara:strand:+ start:315 stop:482 length:168 start_codon:yes stop_codon:yes gene_type:complete
MVVTSAQYLTNGTDNTAIESVIDGETLIVPMDTDNRHYQAIQEWVAEGNTIQEAD